MVTDLSTSLRGISLQNPLIPASGCFGFGDEFLDFYDPNILGAAALKGTTREPQQGNPTPRVAETPAGMINSIGLQNPGIDAVLQQKIPELQGFYHQPIIMNVSAFSVEEYAYLCERADGHAEIIELNVSCPNVHGGGLVFGADPQALAEVVAAVRPLVTESKLYVKLSPNVTDIVALAQLVEGLGADGVTLINTLLGMRVDPQTRESVIARGAGGFSGPAILPVAVRMIHQVYAATELSIMGAGGVASARDVLEMMMAGASAVQVGTQALVNPLVIPEILEELPQLMQELGIERVRDIIGAAHDSAGKGA